MTPGITLVFSILTLAIILFVTERLRVAVASQFMPNPVVAVLIVPLLWPFQP